MNILITGTSGFIGKHLLNFLRHSGNNLSILVRVMSKSPGWAGLNVYQGDICGSEISVFCREKDVVIHLAGIAHTPFFLNFIGGIDAKRINIEGTLNLAKCALENGVKRFIYISSVKVNGDSTFVGARFTADDVPLPQDSYAKQKLQVESELKKFFENSQTELVIIRPCLVYGPCVKGNLAILLWCLKRKVWLPLGMARKNSRTYLGINNLVDFILTCATHPKAAGETFLVGDDQSFSTYELVKELASVEQVKPKFLNIHPKLIIFLMKICGMRKLSSKLFGNLEVDLQKNWEVLNWKPKYNFRDSYWKKWDDYDD